MALTQITSAIVRSVLGATTNKWKSLITHLSINKWSRAKPVRGTYITGTSGKFGFNLPTNWSYLPPRGRLTYNEPYRAGDFRGYEHNTANAYPVMRCILSECTVRALTPFPVASDFNNIWKLRFFKSPGASCVSLSDLGFSGYYYGIKITVDGVSWYKTYGTIAAATDGSGAGQLFSVDASLYDPPNAVYYDLPYGTGTYTYELFISSSSAPAWTLSPPDDINPFPTGTLGADTLITSGTFTVNPWVFADDTEHTWAWNDENYKASNITYPGGGVFTITNNTTWIRTEVWDTSIPAQITNPTLFRTGMQIRFYADNNNSGVGRTGNLVINAAGGSVTITVFQTQATSGISITFLIGNQEAFTIWNTSHGMAIGSSSFTIALDSDISASAWKNLSIARTLPSVVSRYSGSGNPAGIFIEQTGTIKTGELSAPVQNGESFQITIGTNIEE